MLKLAGVKEGDSVYDLGCGDGRIVITAVKQFKAKRGVGIEHRPGARPGCSKENAKKAGVADKVEIREADVLKLKDLSEASVVTLYLLPDINEKLKPVLRKTLKPGARVVSHDFDMGEDWKPDKEVTVKDKAGREHTLYLWTIKDDEGEPKKETPPRQEAEGRAEEGPEAEEGRADDQGALRPDPQNVVEAMLKLAGVKEGDVVYDLGCGDGRIVITAVKLQGEEGRRHRHRPGADQGLEARPRRTPRSRTRSSSAGRRAEDRRTCPRRPSSCLYLFPEVNERLAPMLQKTLKPGSRIVSHDFHMGRLEAGEGSRRSRTPTGDEHTIYLWTIKDKK